MFLYVTLFLEIIIQIYYLTILIISMEQHADSCLTQICLIKPYKSNFTTVNYYKLQLKFLIKKLHKLTRII